MAELAIIVVAALIAPVLMAVVVARGRWKGIIPAARRRRAEAPPGSHRAATRLEPTQTLGKTIAVLPPRADMAFCQACGHATSAHALYCRACGTSLGEA